MEANEPVLTLGARIRALRRARGLTQDRLASSTGVSRSAVAQWESDRAGHSAGMLRRLYRGCSPEDRSVLMHVAEKIAASTGSP